MLRATIIAAAMAAAGTPVMADWVFRTPEAADDLGSVYVHNDRNQRFEVSCGNAGVVSFWINPDPRRPDQLANESFTLVFDDDQDGQVLPTRCRSGSCASTHQLMGEPWTIQHRQALVNSLRSAGSFAIYGSDDARTPLAAFDLRGSTAALGRLKEINRICDGL